MNAQEKLHYMKSEWERHIANVIRDHSDEGPRSIALVAVELADLNGLFDPMKELYARDEPKDN